MAPFSNRARNSFACEYACVSEYIVSVLQSFHRPTINQKLRIETSFVAVFGYFNVSVITDAEIVCFYAAELLALQMGIVFSLFDNGFGFINPLLIEGVSIVAGRRRG